MHNDDGHYILVSGDKRGTKGICRLKEERCLKDPVKKCFVFSGSPIEFYVVRSKRMAGTDFGDEEEGQSAVGAEDDVMYNEEVDGIAFFAEQ
mmetsp:Transcript_15443/g.54102  ORF Transcript_15443/g.54102 Transcript_15443/m.54102 type:complete len:92 (-) Transcript_15443:237-512(-)